MFIFPLLPLFIFSFPLISFLINLFFYLFFKGAGLYFVFFIIPLIIFITISIILLTGILFFWKYFFREHKKFIALLTIILIPPLILFISLSVFMLLFIQRKTRLVKVVDVVNCYNYSQDSSLKEYFIGQGFVIVKDQNTDQLINLLLPLPFLEPSYSDVFIIEKPYDKKKYQENQYEWWHKETNEGYDKRWYNGNFCQKDEIYEKEIKNKSLIVVTNGYGRILYWEIVKDK